MDHSSYHVVTGAFGYSGKYITRRLLQQGQKVITLTNSLSRETPFGDQVKAYPFNFSQSKKLEEILQGVKVLYNTYWVRFNHPRFTHTEAVRNSMTLFKAARLAGVERVVHVSITNPSLNSPLEYFRGKAEVELALIESGLTYAILRPTVLFGKEDILINNIAWALRRLPIFGVFGDGEYRLQPIYVDDLAALAVTHGAGKDNVVIDAIGPETFTYRGLVEVIGQIIGCKRPILALAPRLGFLAGWLIGRTVGDELITWEEVLGLMANLLYTQSSPAGKTRLTDWMRDHSETLGRQYTSELARRVDRDSEYTSN
jgi:NADH dehydrogenase